MPLDALLPITVHDEKKARAMLVGGGVGGDVRCVGCFFPFCFVVVLEGVRLAQGSLGG